MVNFGTGLVPIIVALITVTFSPLLTLAISNLTSHNPIVDVLITPNFDNDGRKALITLTNDGSAPATNVSLTVTTPKKITQIINNFSATSVSLPQLPNSNNRLSLGTPKPIDHPTSFIQVKISKLVHGAGSLTKLQILNNGNPRTYYYNYSGVVIYDQGSSLANTKPLSFADDFNNFIKNGGVYYIILIIISYGTFFFWYYRWFVPKLRRRTFMLIIRTHILSIYHTLNMDPISNRKLDNFDVFIQQWERVTRDPRLKHVETTIEDFWEGIETSLEMERYVSTKDYIYIDKLYIKLRNRKPNLTEDELISYNKDCTRLAENALTRIPWKNYI